MIVQKFGGTSVGSSQRMKQVAELILQDSRPRIVVLSAMSGTTNTLVEISNLYSRHENDKALELIAQFQLKYYEVVKSLYTTEKYISQGIELIDSHVEYLKGFSLDMFTLNEMKCVLAQGELLSTALFQYYLEECRKPSALIQALNFMRIDKDAEPDTFYIRQNLERELKAHPGINLFITQGFICRDTFGKIDNLKRGGSDYSASLIGAAVNASEVQIWTDIDGFHDNDPREVSETHTIPELSFDEAAELAYFGAKILHPATIQPAKNAHIPVVVKNTMDPSAPGTRITEVTTGRLIKAVAAKDGITAIRIRSSRMLLAYGFLGKIFELFDIYRTPIDMITTSEISVSITIDDRTNLDKLLVELGQYGTTEVDHDQVIVCIVGEGIAEDVSSLINVMNALQDIPVRMVSYGGSQNNISILIPAAYKKTVLNSLSRQLF